MRTPSRRRISRMQKRIRRPLVYQALHTVTIITRIASAPLPPSVSFLPSSPARLAPPLGNGMEQGVVRLSFDGDYASSSSVQVSYAFHPFSASSPLPASTCFYASLPCQSCFCPDALHRCAHARVCRIPIAIIIVQNAI